MTEILHADGRYERQARWVAMWREAVRAGTDAIAVVELSSRRFIELSPPAAELLGTTPEAGAGLDYLSVAERPLEAEDTFRLVREGLVDGLRARRWFGRPDGSRVEVESSAWAIRSRVGPELGLWVAREVGSQTGTANGTNEVLTTLPSRQTTFELDRARVAIDDRWRIAHVTSNARSLLGRPPAESVGSSIIELTHPDDRAALIFAFARATTETDVWVRVRLRHHDGSWRTTQVGPTALGGDGDGTSPFALVVAADEDAEAPGSDGEASKLAWHLRRIAAQIEEAGVVIEPTHPLGVPLIIDLSPREREVVHHLVRGERVATIAAEMYLSPSTVRNHLSSIFRKVGVHSQQEFLALWSRGAQGLSP